MSTMIDRIAKVLDAEMERQGFFNPFDLKALACAAIEALRAPTLQMTAAGAMASTDPDLYVADTIYRAMIDAILAESSAPEEPKT